MAAGNPNLLLLKSIAAVYMNRRLESPLCTVEDLVRAVLDETHMPRESLGEGGDGDIAHALNMTLDWLCATRNAVNVREIVARVKINCIHAVDYCDIFEELTAGLDDESIIQERLQVTLSEIRHFFNHQKISIKIKKLNKAVSFDADYKTIDDIVGELNEISQEFAGTSEDENHPGFGGAISLDDIDSIEEVLSRAVELNSTNGVLKTGVKGINRMWGGDGHRRGECVNYGALTHNYKTGILMNYMRWLPMYNVPYMMDEEKKPLILRISFENKLEQDIPELYASMYEAEHNVKVDKKNINPKEAAKYIQSKLGRNGYTIAMECFDPNNFNVWHLIDVVNKYEMMGYEIHALIVDYLELITKADQTRRKDQAITYAFEVMRNHCFPRGITQITAHQLSTEAATLAREGTSSFASKIAANSSYYQDCRSLATKLDAECILHIHKIGESAYLTMARAKHRGGQDTPIKHRNMAIKFKPIGGIVDDVDTEEDIALYSWAAETGDSNPSNGNAVMGANDSSYNPSNSGNAAATAW